MFIEDLIIKLSDLIENGLNQSILISFQEYLLKAGIFTLASQLLSIIIIVYLAFIILFSLLSIVFSFNMLFSIFLAIFIPTITFVLILFIKIERRTTEIPFQIS